MELVGLTEIADLLGVSRQRVHQLSKTAEFPAPLAVLSAGSVWTLEAIQRWAIDTGRIQSADSPQDDHQGPSTSTD